MQQQTYEKRGERASYGIGALGNAFTNLPSQLKSSMDLLNASATPLKGQASVQGIAMPYTPYKDFKRPTFVDDNLEADGRKDSMVDTVVFIDSADRDTRVYPNPFSYRVKFKPLPSDPTPSLPKNFTNVRSVRMDLAVMPRKYNLSTAFVDHALILVAIKDLLAAGTLPAAKETFTAPDGSTVVIIHSFSLDGRLYTNYCAPTPDLATMVTETFEAVYDPSTQTYTLQRFNLGNEMLDKDKYLMLHIDEIRDVNELATNFDMATSFAVLYPSIVNGDFYYLESFFVEKIFKFSQLGNLNQFTISFSNSVGNKLTINTRTLDKHVRTPKTCVCARNELGNVVRDYACSCVYIRHPLYIKFQNTLMFKVSHVEAEIHKKIFN